MKDKVRQNLFTVKSNSGFALMGTLVLVFVVSTFGIALLTMTQNEIKNSALQKASTEAFYIAESGVDHAISYLETLETPNFSLPKYLNESGDHYIDFGNGQYKASVQSAGVFSYIIRSIGERPWTNTSGKVTKEIESKVILENFALYAYFTNSEFLPTEISGGSTNQKIWFYGDDHIRGPVHSNGRLHMAGTPTFDGNVTSSYVNKAVNPWDISWEAYDSNTNPNFNGPAGFQGGIDEIPLPEFRDISEKTDSRSLQRKAAGTVDFINNHQSGNGAYVPNDGFNVSDGIWVKGDVSTLSLGVDPQDNSKITITQTGKTTTIYQIENTTTIGGNTYTPGTTVVDVYEGGSHSYSDLSGHPNGVLYVDGEIKNLRSVDGQGLKGKLTIASDETITIGDNLLYNTRVNDPNCFNVTEGYPDIDDSLGLVSEENIMIDNNAPHNIEINAIIMALETSFYYEGWQNNMQGDLTFHGSLIQKQRGPVGTFNSWGKQSGYTKQYYFDKRMSIGNPNLGQVLPPYFPTTGKYVKMYWKEI